MKKLLVIAGLLVSVGLQSQTVRKFEWRMDIQSDIATLQSYTYRYFLDTSTTGIVLTGVVCTATPGPWTCAAPVPTTIKGTHTVTITVSTSSAGTQSPKSNQISFNDSTIPVPVGPKAPSDLSVK